MKTTLINLIQTTLATAVIAGSAFVFAGDGNRHSERERRGPPPEAFEACASAAEGDVCEVQTRRGNVRTGECRVPRRHKHVRGDALDSTNPENSVENSTADTQSGESVALLCVPEHRRRFRDEEAQLR